jgi:hypothetical protein
MESVHNHGDVYVTVLINVDYDGIEDSDTLAAMAVNSQPPATSAAADDDPEFHHRLQKAIALSIQESWFDAFLHDKDEHHLSVGVEQAIACVDAIATWLGICGGRTSGRLQRGSS